MTSTNKLKKSSFTNSMINRSESQRKINIDANCVNYTYETKILDENNKFDKAQKLNQE